jgi:CHASE2 domain-containing sensor protein
VPLSIVVIAVTLGLVAARHLVPLAIATDVVADIETAKLRPSAPQSTDLLLVTIDETTLAPFPSRSPLDRRFLAGLLQRIAEGHPKAIVVDVLFDHWTGAEADAELRRVLAALNIPLIVSYIDGSGLTEAEQRYLDSFVEPSWRGFARLELRQSDGVVVSIDEERVLADGSRVEAIPFAVARKLGLDVRKRKLDIAWRGPPSNGHQPFAMIPAHLVGSRVPRSFFTDKIVIVGADLSLEDRHRAPLDAANQSGIVSVPGAVILAHAIDQLVTGREPPTAGLGPELLVAVIAAGCGLLVVIRLSAWWLRLLLGAVVIIGLWVLAFALFRYAAIQIAPVSSTLSACIAMWAGEIYARQRLRERPGRHVPSADIH